VPVPSCIANSALFKRFTIAILFVSATPVASLACSYFSSPDPPTEYIVSRTKTIFLGSLLQKGSRIQKVEGDRYRIHSLIFRIEQKLKGDPRDTYLIECWDRITGRDSCYEERPNPKVGEKWVIFHGYDEGRDTLLSVRDPDYLSWHFARDDSRSTEGLKSIKEAIANPRSTFFGEIEMGMFDMPPEDPSLRVELLDSSRRFIIRTAVVEKGHFSLSNLEPGTYFVRLRSSKQYGFFQPASVKMQKDNHEAPYFADFKIEMSRAMPEFLNFSLNL
jgi:hypothetical protein